MLTSILLMIQLACLAVQIVFHVKQFRAERRGNDGWAHLQTAMVFFVMVQVFGLAVVLS